MDLHSVRVQVAEAVTAAGIPCVPYSPDSPVPPVSWVDSMSLDYQTAASFCIESEITFTIVTSAQRNDRAGGTKRLEALIPEITQRVEKLGAVRTIAVNSGSTTIGSTDVPAVLYQFQATVS